MIVISEPKQKYPCLKQHFFVFENSVLSLPPVCRQSPVLLCPKDTEEKAETVHSVPQFPAPRWRSGTRTTISLVHVAELLIGSSFARRPRAQCVRLSCFTELLPCCFQRVAHMLCPCDPWVDFSCLSEMRVES